MFDLIGIIDFTTKEFPEKIEAVNFKILVSMITKKKNGEYHNRIWAYSPYAKMTLCYYWENNGKRFFEKKTMMDLKNEKKILKYKGNECRWKSMDKDGEFVYGIDGLVYHFETNQIELWGWYAILPKLSPRNIKTLKRTDVREIFPDLNSTGFLINIENETKGDFYCLELDDALEVRFHRDLIALFRAGVDTEKKLNQKYGKNGGHYKKQELKTFSREYYIDTYNHASCNRFSELKSLKKYQEIDVLQWKDGIISKETNKTSLYSLLLPEDGKFDGSELDFVTNFNLDMLICNFEVWNKNKFVAYVERTIDTYKEESMEYQASFVVVKSEYINDGMTMAEFCKKTSKIKDIDICNSKNLRLDYDLEKSDIKCIPFYLPQFHENEENNKWWGKGFTEWTNVRKAEPQFEGHRQPRIPGELGYYLLDGIETQKKQIYLAKKMGIYGFCYYYYWFNGKRLLRKPIDQFLENPELDFPFCICWANESWTRRWDGGDQDILMEQVHTKESDEAFIYDILPILKDKRYIRYKGRPVLIVYRIELFPSPRDTIQRWRRICKKEGIPDLYVAIVQSFDCIDNRIYGADAAIEFPPHKVTAKMINHRIKDRIFPGFEGEIYSYYDLVSNMELIKKREYNYIPGIMKEWDNTARKGKKAHIYTEYSEEMYMKWMIKNCVYADMYVDEKMIFINAWNEWAEGTYLEPEIKEEI